MIEASAKSEVVKGKYTVGMLLQYLSQLPNVGGKFKVVRSQSCLKLMLETAVYKLKFLKSFSFDKFCETCWSIKCF